MYTAPFTSLRDRGFPRRSLLLPEHLHALLSRRVLLALATRVCRRVVPACDGGLVNLLQIFLRTTPEHLVPLGLHLRLGRCDVSCFACRHGTGCPIICSRPVPLRRVLCDGRSCRYTVYCTIAIFELSFAVEVNNRFIFLAGDYISRVFTPSNYFVICFCFCE